MRRGSSKISGRRSNAVCAAAIAGVLLLPASAVQARVVKIGEYRPPATALAKLRNHWANQTISRFGVHTWAPIRFNLSNRDLRLMGLPPKRVLLSHRYRVPTKVYPSGRIVRMNRSGKGGGKGG